MGGPTEWAPGYVEVQLPVSSWAEVALERNGEAMPLTIQRIAGAPRIVAPWPYSGAGGYDLTLHLPDDSVERTSWEVPPRKISPTEFDALLLSLETDLPVSIAISLQKLGALTGIELLPPAESTLAQELVRLRRAVDGTESHRGLVEVLYEVAREPHDVLTSREVWVTREAARRVKPASLVRAMAGHNLDAEGIPKRLPDLRVDPTVDVYENRLIRTFFEQVHTRLRRLVPLLERKAQMENALDAIEMRQRLEHARRQASFLDQVSALAQPPTTLTMVLLKRPAYRHGLMGFLELHRSAAARLDEPLLDSPLESLPDLYELWGVLQVIREILSLADDLGYEVRQNQVVGRDVGGIFVRVLKNGRPAVVLRRKADETVVKVIPQATYRHAGAIRSVSYPQVPDLAVEVERPSSRRLLYLFDPKYKLDSDVPDEAVWSGRPKKVDIDKMHAYRDSIRDESNRRVVRSAAILYPGANVEFAPGLGAHRAIPGAEAELRTAVRTTLTQALQGEPQG